MTSAPPRLQYTSVRTQIVDDQVLIGLKHTAKDANGQQVKHEWVEMPPETARGLIKTIQETLDELDSSATKLI